MNADLTLIAKEPFEHVPGANQATCAFIIYDKRCDVWLIDDNNERAVKVFEVEPREPFVRGGAKGVRDVLRVLEDDLEDTLTAHQVEFATEVLPIVKRCLPYWGKP